VKRSRRSRGLVRARAATVFLAAVAGAACGRRTVETRSAPSASTASDPPPAAPPSGVPVDAPAASTRTPPELSCLERYYGGRLLLADGRWWLDLGGGQRLLFDDGRTKSFDERLEAPDLEDLFAVEYPTGPIVPITRPNGDPGRVRSLELLAATYGDGEGAVRSQLVGVSLLGSEFTAHRKVLPALRRVESRLERLARSDPSVRRYFAHPGGGFVYRKIAGTERLSAHAFGIAVDLDPKYGAYHLWDRGKLHYRNEIPANIVSAFESEGFVWGGRWYHYDTIHFEYRPELLDPACRRAGSAAGERHPSP